MTEILAPVQIDSMHVRESSISVADSPAKSMKLGLRVEVAETEMVEDDKADVYRLPIDMTVRITYLNSEDEEDERLSAMANVVARLSISRQLGERDEAFTYLRRNGVSMAYAHARSYIMTLAALSPIGSLIIPPVVPDALLAERDDTEDGKE